MAGFRPDGARCRVFRGYHAPVQVRLAHPVRGRSRHAGCAGVDRSAGHLAVDVAVWGVPEEMQQDEQEAGKPVLRVSVPLVFKGLSLRFFDAKGTVIARLDGGGEPALRLDMPARLVVDAPPGLTLGRYELPQFPPDVAEVEWTLAAQVRSPSGEGRIAQATWKTKAEPG